jgi:triacylglycerol lipase
MLLIDLIKEYFLFVSNWFNYYGSSIPEDWQRGEIGDMLLIPGFSENWYFLKEIGDLLNSKGYRIHVLKDARQASIESQAFAVQEYVKNKKLQNILLIGHSKGGLVARKLLTMQNLFNIQKVITISTPHHGTIFGYLRLFNLAELIPGSKFFASWDYSLNKQIYNFYPRFDNHVIPASSLLLAGAENELIGVNGHTRILKSSSLLTKLQILLETK